MAQNVADVLREMIEIRYDAGPSLCASPPK